MFLDYSNIKLDAYGRPETPTLFLQTLSGETIGVLSGVTGLNIRVKFSEPSELNFDISAKIESNGVVIDNPMYKEILGQRVIHTKVYGNYIIMNPESDSDGIKDEIHVTAYSLEKQWEKKILFLEEGTYNFWNPVNSEDTIFGRMLELMPGWSVGYVSSTLIGKYRTFDQYDDYLLDFAYNSIPEKYRCVCVFDTYEKTISAYDVDEQYDTIPIYLDFDNLLESVNVTELTDELVTAISPYGEDNLDIRDVNPTGSNWIYDLSYFISNGDIPSALATKWDAWQTAILSHREMYYGLVALRNSKMAQVLSENAAIVDMDGILSGYRYNQSVTLQAIKMEITDEGREEQEEVLEGINQQIADQEAAIAEKKSAVEDLEDEIEELNGEIANLVDEIRYTEYFTDEERATLSNYIIEMVLTEETFVSNTFSGSGQVSGAAGTTSGAVEIEDSAITRISLNEDYGKTMYTFSGGTFSHSGDFDISGDIIRGTLEIGTSDQKFIMTAYLGDMTVDDDRYPSATVTLYGDSSNETDDIASVMDGEVETFEGTDLSFTALSDTYLYVSTSVSEFEKYSVQLELLDYAKSTLKDLATPSYEFSVDSGNFVFAKEFEQFRDELQLGRGIHLNLGHGEVITPYIIEIAIDFEDHSKLDLVFSNKFKRHDQVNTLKDMIEKSYSSSRSFDASKYTYNRTANKQSEVDKFMSGALDAAKNTIIAAQDQSVVIDGAGIRVNGEITDGQTDKNVELRIVNGMIAITDDNWNNAKLAIGYFKTDEGSYYGVNADVIAGKLLVGNNLVIESTTDQGDMMFKVDQSGAWLYNSQFLLQSEDGGSMMLHPDYGFAAGSGAIYRTSGTTVTPAFIDSETGEIIDADDDGYPDDVNFYIGMDGNVYLKGNVKAESGDIGGWTIADNKLYSGSDDAGNNTSTYVALSSSGDSPETAMYAIWAGDESPATAPFFVKRDGTVRIKNGDFSGGISAATITSTAISGGTISGSTVSGGSINIGNGNFIVDSNGNVTLNGNITWGPGTDRPVGQIYALYTRALISKPTNAYNTYPATHASSWHRTLDSENDYYMSFSYDDGVTWTDPIKVRGSDGTPGSGATVTRGAIVDAMLQYEQQDGLYSYTINNNKYLGINAAAILTGRIASSLNPNNWWDLDTGELHVSGSSISISAGDAVSTAITSSVNAGITNANNYTDSQIVNFATTVNGYVQDLEGMIEDGLFITYYEDYQPTLSNYPANTWSSDDMENHEGDLFYWKSTGYAYRFTYENNQYKWAFIRDAGVTQALADAEDAYDLADKKRRTFTMDATTSHPTPPYDVGDLWFEGPTGEIRTCTTAKAAGEQYAFSDWSKLNKYTDDSTLLDWKNGEYATTISSIQGQVDAKINTYYQSSDPSTDWNTTALKDVHTGDLWYNSTASVKKYYKWAKNANNTYSWHELSASEIPPGMVFDALDSKRQIFTSQPTPPYEVGDLWVQGSGGDIMRCRTDRTSGSYNESDWVLASKYTDDTRADAAYALAQSGIVSVDVQYARNQSSSTAPTSGWNTNPPEWESGYYIWQRTVTTLAGGTTSTSTARCITGIKGETGVGITSIEEQYYLSTDDSSQTGGSWSTTCPEYVNGCFYWTRSLITWDDGTSDTTDPVLAGGLNSANKAIYDLVVGGANMMINTLEPGTTNATIPRIRGQVEGDVRFSSNQTLSVATHGIRTTVTSADYPRIIFGNTTASASGASMIGLTAGETYTLSFDTTFKLCSGSIPTSTTNYYYARLYYATSSATSYTAGDYVYIHTYATSDRSDRGATLTGRCEFTFTVPVGTTRCYLAIRPNSTTGSYYASGDFIEVSNLMLEKGSKATSWSPAWEDYTKQIDSKAETWYQDSNPATSWTTNDLKEQHVGDMWYCSNANDSTYGQRYFRWAKGANNTYSWEELTSSIPTAMFDKFDGKATVFVGTNTPTDPQKGDLWLKSADDPILTYVQIGTNTYDWREFNYYTDDSAVENLRIGGRNIIRNTKDYTGWRTTNGATFIESEPTYIINYPAVSSDTFIAATPSLAIPYSIVRNQTITFSCMAKTSATSNCEMLLELDISSSEEGNRIKYTNRTIPFTPTGDWQKLVEQYDIQDSIFTLGSGTVDYNNCYIRPVLYKNSTTHPAIQIREFQIEIGNIATDWGPALADYDAEIAALNNWVDTTYASEISQVRGQLDKKADTYYQSQDPAVSEGWNTAAIRAEHVGDLWYDTVNNKSFTYTGDPSNGINGWVESDAPQGVYDKIDGKAAVFVGPTTPQNPQERDLWFPGEDQPILTYVRIGNTETFEWREYNKYTDDSAIDNLKIGSRNLMINTLYPGTTNDKIPRILGQVAGDVRFSSNQTLTTATHGIRTTVTSAEYPRIIFGNTSVSASGASMIGLTAGGTYTLSFDTKFKLFSGSIPTSTEGTYYARLYHSASSSSSYTAGDMALIHTYATSSRSDRGATLSDRCEFTFTVPATATRCYIAIRPSSTTNSYYASGDFIEVSNLQLEEGNIATSWYPALEDIAAAINDIEDYFDDELTEIGNQIDKKAQTYYQPTDPSLSTNSEDAPWDAAKKEKHVGDLWYNSTSTVQKYYRYTKNGSTYGWQELTASPPDAVASVIANKASIFSGSTTPSGAQTNDLWFPGPKEPIYTYVNNQWVVYNMYTDDSSVLAGRGGFNLLLDTYTDVSDASKVNGPSKKYISDNGNTGTTFEFIADNNLPDPNATQFLRFANSSSAGARALGFYSNHSIPIINGHYYRMSCYARSTTGPTTLQLWYSDNRENKRSFTVTSNWEKYEFVSKFIDSGSTSSTYKRTYFYFRPTAVGQSLDMCGFSLVDVTGEAEDKKRFPNDNLIPRTNDFVGWGKASGVTIEDDPTEDGIKMLHFPSVSSVSYRGVYAHGSLGVTIPYGVVRDQTVTVSYWVKVATPSVGMSNACTATFSVALTATADRVRYSANQVPAYALTETTEWQKVCYTLHISDDLFTNGNAGTEYTDDMHFYIQFYNHSTSESWFKKPKLEYGWVDTEWAPNSKDALSRDGKNLLTGSNMYMSTSEQNIANYFFGDEKPVEGAPYVLQVKGTLGSGRTGFGVYNSGGVVYESDFGGSNDGANIMPYYDETEHIWTLIIPYWKVTQGSTTANNTYLGIYQFPSSGTSTSTIEWVKLEKGTVPTGWTYAPEDYDTKIEDLVIGGENLLRASDLTRIRSFTNSGGEWSDGQYCWSSSGNGTVTVVDIADAPVSVKKGFRITGNTTGNKDFQQRNIPLKQHTDYTFSAYIRTINGTTATILSRFWDRSGSKAVASTSTSFTGSKWTRWSITKNSGAMTNGKLDFSLGVTGSSADIEICAPQLEEGNKATSWTLSQQDFIDRESDSKYFGTCTTGASTVAKVVTCPTFNELTTGVTIEVLFTYANTANNPTMNVNGTGPKYIYVGSTQLTSTSYYNWPANSVVTFIYNGSYWVMQDTHNTMSQTAVYNRLTGGRTTGGLYIDNGDVCLNANYINTGTLGADRIAAGSIAADKLNANSIKTTFLTADNINSSNIKLYGNMTVYTGSSSTTAGGSLGYASGNNGSSTTNGIKICSANGNNYVIATDSGCRMTADGAGERDVFVTSNGPTMRYDTNKYVSVTSNGPGMTIVSSSNVTTRVEVHDGTFVPTTNNKVHLGSSALKWTDVYANTATIQTSDRNQKYNISYDVDKYIDLFDELQPVSYKLVDGESGRTHLGMIAQDIEELIDEKNIDSRDFAAFIKENVDGTDIYGLRYEEFIPILIGKIQRQQQQIDRLMELIEDTQEVE